MAVLLLRLSGPMQSWGTQSRFSERDTGTEPSKSGVIGLICAALGRDRSENIEDLSKMRFGLRVDREGEPSKDYHTTENVLKAGGSLNSNAVLSNRYYLADAKFLVGMESDNIELLVKIHESLKNPKWTLFLGRKSFPLSEPAYLENGINTTDSLETALGKYPYLCHTEIGEKDKVRCVLEVPSISFGMTRHDNPVSFEKREFQPRRVEIKYLPIPKESLCI